MVTESHRVNKTIKQPLLSIQSINFQLGLIILQARAFFSIPGWTSFSQGTQILQNCVDDEDFSHCALCMS